jgi:hypothetical protein
MRQKATKQAQGICNTFGARPPGSTNDALIHQLACAGGAAAAQVLLHHVVVD